MKFYTVSGSGSPIQGVKIEPKEKLALMLMELKKLYKNPPKIPDYPKEMSELDKME